MVCDVHRSKLFKQAFESDGVELHKNFRRHIEQLHYYSPVNSGSSEWITQSSSIRGPIFSCDGYYCGVYNLCNFNFSSIVLGLKFARLSLKRQKVFCSTASRVDPKWKIRKSLNKAYNVLGYSWKNFQFIFSVYRLPMQISVQRKIAVMPSLKKSLSSLRKNTILTVALRKVVLHCFLK